MSGGVGTKLAAAYDQPALGGVYKLSALREPGGEWQYRLKLSEDGIKTSDPGILQIRRYHRDGQIQGDVIFNEPFGVSEPPRLHPATGNPFSLPAGVEGEDLLVPVFTQGELVYQSPLASEARARTSSQLALLPAEMKELKNPVPYPVGLDAKTHELRQALRESFAAKGSL